MIYRQVGLIYLRYLSLLYCFIALIVIYFLYRELNCNKETSLWALIFFYSLSLVSLAATFSKSYALQILVCAAALLFYLRALHYPKILNHILSLALFHMAFLVHYFSILNLLPLYLLIDLQKQKQIIHRFRSVFYALSLIIYWPIVSIQYQHTSKYFHESYPFLRDLKYFWRLVMRLYGLNFKSIFAYLIIGFLLWCFIKSPNKKSISFFFFFSLSSSIALLIYDQITCSHMIGTIRYVLPALPFIALVLSLLAHNLILRLIIIVLLLINILMPCLVDIKMLNASIDKRQIKGIQNIADNSSTSRILILVSGYGIKNLMVLHELQSKLLRIKAIEAVSPQMIEANIGIKNIFVINIKSMSDQASIDSFIFENDIEDIYVLPAKDQFVCFPNLNLTKYKSIY